MSDRYRLPDPKCQHAPKGRVGVPGGPSTYVCDRGACIEDTKDWVEAKTGQRAEFIPMAFKRPSAESLRIKAAQDSFWAEHPEVAP